MVTNYTVGSLQPSSTMIPGFTPKGQLYQADITARADGGIVTPLVSDSMLAPPTARAPP